MDERAYPGARLDSPSVAPVSFNSSPPTQVETSPSGLTPTAPPPTASRPTRHRYWAAGVGALLALNLGLAGANLHVFGLPPFSDMMDMPDASSGQAVVSTLGRSDAPNDVQQVERNIIDAPAGPEPEAATPIEPALTEPANSAPTIADSPMKIMAAISQSGELMIAGSVPDQETADQLLAEAARHLPGGDEQILSDIKVHPNASFDAAQTRVLLWEPAIFAQGSSVLDAQFTPILDVGIEMLAASPDLKVAVTGHASPDGHMTPNLFLSASRVAAVLAYLENAGVPEAQIITIAAGESEPEDGDLGRRVEVEIANFFGEG